MRDLERKLQKYAVPNLTLKLFILNAIGMVISYLPGVNGIVRYLYLDPYQVIHHFQIWRIVSWILIPASSSLFWYALMAILFYIPIGRQMEAAWGDFKYNAYLLLGFLYTIVGTFLVYGFYALAVRDATVMEGVSQWLSVPITPYYVMFSIAFAFAVTFPDVTILFMFLIPVKMKWLGVLWGANLAYEVFRIATSQLPSPFKVSFSVVILASVLNFIVFWLTSQRMNLWRFKPGEVKRRQDFKRAMHMGARPAGGTIHRCTICGRTENDNPDLEFRYCSKCKGGREYCSDHLFTHEHV